MASSPTLTPPPGMDQGAPPSAPTTPPAAAPSPPQPSPATNTMVREVTEVVDKLRGIAKAYPEAAPFVSQINDLMREVMAAIMKRANVGEATAPPSGG